MRHTRFLLSLVLLAAVVALGCADSQSSPTAPDLSADGLAVTTEGNGQTKIDICHVTGNDEYMKINVAAPAVPAHEAHGDAQVGAAVPDQPGFVFDDSCTPVAAGPTCPCWADKTVDDLVVLFAEADSAFDLSFGASVFGTEGDPLTLSAFTFNSSCARNDAEGSVGPLTGLSTEEFDACLADVLSVKDALGL